MSYKHIISLMAVTVLLACACNTPKSYKVTGTTTGFPDSCKVLVSTAGMYKKNLDSTFVIDGKFEMELPYDSVSANSALIVICLKPDVEHDRWSMTQFYAEPGATIQVHLDLEEAENNSVGGSPLNDIENRYQQEINKVADIYFKYRMQAADETLSKEEREKASVTADSLSKEITKVHERFAIDNVDNLIGISILSDYSKFFSKEAKEKFLSSVPEKFQDHPVVVKERELLAAMVSTEEGEPMADFEMATPEGQTVKLSELVKQHKLTLVDFWASWCAPCRKEIPHIKKIHADYKSQGLALVGVSFDDNKDKWVKGIADLQLNYPQMSDLKGWESDAAIKYDIKAIPFTLLVNQDGIIVGRNLGGEELIKRIEEQLKN